MTFADAQEYKTRAGSQPAFVLYQSKSGRFTEIRLLGLSCGLLLF